MRSRVRRPFVSAAGVVGVAWVSLFVAPSGWSPMVRASEGSLALWGNEQGAQPTADETGGGQTGQGHTAPASDDADLLAGPSAAPVDVPGASGIFSQGMEGARRNANTGAKIDRQLERLLRQMGSERAPDEIKLSPDQLGAIKVAMDAHRERVAAYRREHASEIRELREAVGVGENDRVGRPDGNGAPTEATEAMNAARQRLREINRAAPKSEQARGEVWAVLTEQQREHINTELERIANERAQNAASMTMGGGDAMAPRDGAQQRRAQRQGAGSTGDERLDDLVRRLRALPEAQRDRAIDRILGALERFERSAQESDRRRRAPTMDDAGVRVPGVTREPRGERPQRRRPDRDSDSNADT